MVEPHEIGEEYSVPLMVLLTLGSLVQLPVLLIVLITHSMVLLLVVPSPVLNGDYMLQVVMPILLATSASGRGRPVRVPNSMLLVMPASPGL